MQFVAQPEAQGQLRSDLVFVCYEEVVRHAIEGRIERWAGAPRRSRQTEQEICIREPRIAIRERQIPEQIRRLRHIVRIVAAHLRASLDAVLSPKPVEMVLNEMCAVVETGIAVNLFGDGCEPEPGPSDVERSEEHTSELQS